MRLSKAQKTKARKHNQGGYIAPPRGKAYPMAPVRLRQVDKTRYLLKLLASADETISDEQMRAQYAMIDALSILDIKDVLISNGFTIVRRKELQVVKVNKDTIQTGPGVRFSEAVNEGGTSQILHLTQLAG